MYEVDSQWPLCDGDDVYVVCCVYESQYANRLISAFLSFFLYKTIRQWTHQFMCDVQLKM